MFYPPLSRNDLQKLAQEKIKMTEQERQALIVEAYEKGISINGVKANLTGWSLNRAVVSVPYMLKNEVGNTSARVSFDWRTVKAALKRDGSFKCDLSYWSKYGDGVPEHLGISVHCEAGSA